VGSIYDISEDTYPAQQTLRQVLESVDSALASQPLKRSAMLFTAQNLPKTFVDCAYCLQVQTKNTGKYREGGEQTQRSLQTITVSLLKQISPMNQFDSLLKLTDIEQGIMAAMCMRSNFPFGVVHHIDTVRTLLPTREYMVVDLHFSLEHAQFFGELSP